VAKISKQIPKKQKRRAVQKLLNITQETADIASLKESLNNFISEFQVCELLLITSLELTAMWE